MQDYKDPPFMDPKRLVFASFIIACIIFYFIFMTSILPGCSNNGGVEEGDKSIPEWIVIPRGCDTTGIANAYWAEYPHGTDSTSTQQFVNNWCNR